MYKFIVLLFGLSTCLAFTGCGTSAETVTAERSIAVAAYCGTCGFEEGGDSCCVEDAEKCSCGMSKGSPLCCKVKGDFANKSLCGLCGHVTGTEECCVEDAEKCSCGMTKGSPLCCNLSEKE